MNRSRLLIGSLLGILAILIGFSIHLALTRTYQVDECQNLYMAKIVARGESKEFFTTSYLFLFGPLSWLTRTHLHSAEMFSAARLMFLSVFWLNLVLLAAIASGRLFSLRGLIALLSAATLSPLWNYGFEIRHDNLVVTGILLMWWFARVKPLGRLSYLFVGAISVALMFITVKAVVYVFPLSFAILAFPPPGHNKSRLQLALAWMGGAILAAVLVRLAYGFKGDWDNYLNAFRIISNYSTGKTGSSKFRPWGTLALLLVQTPLLLAFVTAALATFIGALLRRGKAALTWEGLLPEILFVLGALGVLVINPTPFPYNLILVVPFAFILAFRYAVEVKKVLLSDARLWPLLGTLLIVAQLMPFTNGISKNLALSNARQKELMRLAEDLTDPVKDPVYDGIGMVPTRPSVHLRWYLHSLALELITTPGSRVRDMLAARPAAVVIPSYRTDWLPDEDGDFIKQRYIPLADDFEVLGTVLPAGGGAFEIFHPGRYCIVPAASLPMLEASTNAPDQSANPVTGTLDGQPFSNTPIELAVGTHRLETSSDRKLAIVWVGPVLSAVPRLNPGNHQTLFLKWVIPSI